MLSRKNWYTIWTWKTWINEQGRPFDRTIVSQLISSVDKSPNHMVSQDDFIKAWTDMESKLRDKIERNQAEIKKCQLSVSENVL